MKLRTVSFIVFLVLLVTVLSCENSKSKKIEQLTDIQGKVVGVVASGISVEANKEMVKGFIGGEPKDIVVFNRGADGLAALLSGKIDALPMHMFSADYLLKRNPELKAIPVEGEVKGGVIMITRNENQELKERLDSALIVLEENGFLKELEDKWVTNLPGTNEPSNTEIGIIENAETIRVGVTGDFTPLDYIAADGKSAGYSIALLTEIGKMLNLNFEFISLETQARFTALAGNKIDLIFCHFQSDNTKYFDELKNNNWISTKPYYNYEGGCFIVRK